VKSAAPDRALNCQLSYFFFISASLVRNSPK
jgi:hypothetical protein